MNSAAYQIVRTKADQDVFKIIRKVSGFLRRSVGRDIENAVRKFHRQLLEAEVQKLRAEKQQLERRAGAQQRANDQRFNRLEARVNSMQSQFQSENQKLRAELERLDARTTMITSAFALAIQCLDGIMQLTAAVQSACDTFLSKTCKLQCQVDAYFAKSREQTLRNWATAQEAFETILSGLGGIIPGGKLVVALGSAAAEIVELVAEGGKAVHNHVRSIDNYMAVKMPATIDAWQCVSQLKRTMSRVHDELRAIKNAAVHSARHSPNMDIAKLKLVKSKLDQMANNVRDGVSPTKVRDRSYILLWAMMVHKHVRLDVNVSSFENWGDDSWPMMIGNTEVDWEVICGPLRALARDVPLLFSANELQGLGNPFGVQTWQILCQWGATLVLTDYDPDSEGKGPGRSRYSTDLWGAKREAGFAAWLERKKNMGTSSPIMKTVGHHGNNYVCSTRRQVYHRTRYVVRHSGIYGAVTALQTRRRALMQSVERLQLPPGTWDVKAELPDGTSASVRVKVPRPRAGVPQRPRIQAR